MVEQLKRLFENLLEKVNLDFKRASFDEIGLSNEWPIVLIGERGVGKTYLLLQKLSQQPPQVRFYFSMDNPLIKGISLFDLVEKLYFEYWIRYLIIDEIQKGEYWAKNIKSVIDNFPDLQLIVSGSSSLDLYKWTADLQRRIHKHHLFPFNFSEYLKYAKGISIPSFSFSEIIKNYKKISYDLSNQIYQEDIQSYLREGFYPYFKGKEKIYHDLLLSNLQKTILEDIPTFMNFQTSSLAKFEKLFYFIAHNKPSDMNYKSMADLIGVSKDLLETVVFYLDQIGVINTIVRSNKLKDILRKEYKIFMGNPNILYAYNAIEDKWAMRESFILHVLKKISKKMPINTDIILPQYGDVFFRYEGEEYLFEIGGKNKTKKQIHWWKNAFLIKDDILIGRENEIPLRLFGLIQ